MVSTKKYNSLKLHLKTNEACYDDSDLDSERSKFNQNFYSYFSTPCNYFRVFRVFYNFEGKNGCFPPLHPNQVASRCIFSNIHPKCVNVCKISPEAGRGIMRAVLSSHNGYLAIPQQCFIRGSTPSLFTDHVCSGKSTSWANTSVTENFIKIKFFNLKSSFDQATQKKYKKAILFGKINIKVYQNYSINMMSQINVPIYSHENDKNPVIYYKLKINEYEKKSFGNFYLANGTSYIDSDVILGSSAFYNLLI